MKPDVSPVAELPATAIHRLSSEPQDGVALGGLALVASPEAVVPSGGVVPCHPVIRIACHWPVVLTLAVHVGVVPASVPSAIL